MALALNIIATGLLGLAVYAACIALTFAPAGVILLFDHWKERHP